MNGIELAKAYYETYGRPMLEEQFPQVLPYLAVAFCGSGSEHFGFDDEVSRDHDMEPGFCIFLPSEQVVDRRTEFLLSRAYAKLPREFGGLYRLQMAPVGGSRSGVMRTEEFFREKTGGTELTPGQWLRIPDYALAEAVNGAVFYDEYGEFTRIRQALSQMPLEIRKKRIAGNLFLMGQSGQYNFSRCLEHGEFEAAQLAAAEFVQAAMKAVFLIYGRYLPFYKWGFRALRQLESELPEKAAVSGFLSALLSGDNRDPQTVLQKKNGIEKTAEMLAEALSDRGILAAEGSGSGRHVNVYRLGDPVPERLYRQPPEKDGDRAEAGMPCSQKNGGTDLEPLAYAVNDSIADSELRTLHILAGV